MDGTAICPDAVTGRCRSGFRYTWAELCRGNRD